jgi:hypothetical protein
VGRELAGLAALARISDRSPAADPSEIQLIALHGASFRARRLGQVCTTPTLSVIGIHAATTAAPALAEIAA